MYHLKIKSLCILLFFCTSTIIAQFEYEWGITIGADHTDRATSMKLDKDGNIFLAGMYSNTVDFDPGPGITTLTGEINSAFLAKYTKDGEFLWVRDLNISTDQTSPNQLPDLDVDAAGNSFIISYLGNDQESTIYFARYDADGNLSWAHEILGSDNDIGWAIHALPSGDCVMAGRFSGTRDFNTGPGEFQVSSIGPSDLFIARYDKTGALIWIKNIGGATISQSKINHITIDQNEEVYIAGEIHNTFDFDPQNSTTNSVISVDGRKAFIAKYAIDSEFIWAQSIGDIGSAFVSEIIVDHQNDIVITGRFSNAIDFDPGMGSSNFIVEGLLDGYLAKYNSDGALIWGFPVASEGTDEGIGIAVDEANNIHLTGFFGGASGIDLDPSPEVALFPNQGVYDMYYSLYNQDGNYVEAFVIGGTENVETGIGLGIDEAGSVVIAGWYHSENVDFDVTTGTDIQSATLADIFIVKYKHPNIPTNIFSPEITEIKTFPNPVYTGMPIYFDLPFSDQTEVVILDLNGRVVSTPKKANAVLSPATPGMYVLLFYENGLVTGLQKLAVMLHP